MTDYVVTRWYRAPELLCDNQTYDKKVDVWSAGLIFAELLVRRPLLQVVHALAPLAIAHGVAVQTPCSVARGLRHWCGVDVAATSWVTGSLPLSLPPSSLPARRVRIISTS